MSDVTFLGACGTVTGSMSLLAWGEHKVLVDCGMFQGGLELEQRNREPFPFAPVAIDAVVLTHAHLDHSGRLPLLALQGFRGPIYCSRPTRGLVSLVLRDAAKLQEEEAGYARRHNYSRHAEPTPLYREEDARQALQHIRRVAFDEPFEVLPGISVRLRRAGHLLGAATAELTAKGSDGERRTWCFSGDVGRFGVPILQDPEPPLSTPDTVLLESTYGDRRHPAGDPRAALGEIIRETFGRGGMLLIPAFALGRTQDLLYHLAALVDAGELAADTVFVDSPMAISATELYAEFPGEYDEDLTALVAADKSPFALERFARCRTREQSQALNARREPAVIVAGSGMANGGRIVHHLELRLPDPRNTVLFAGFQAAGTRGRALVDGAQELAIHGHTVPVRAQVKTLQMLSAHGDRDELLRWARALPAPPRRVFLNHGEDPSRESLARALQAEVGWPLPGLPIHGQKVPF
ncbi:MAG TPA: MBL fold metallo-hydrolase [Thermoanaerobaculia bacterium]|nr:MBL fold metallo-hydrolase [Thermoanaerobaculia bacterium]